jgi:hypothetical protein
MPPARRTFNFSIDEFADTTSPGSGAFVES